MEKKGLKMSSKQESQSINAALHFILKGLYDAFLKIIIFGIWCNRICWHAFMLKNTKNVKYCTLL